MTSDSIYMARALELARHGSLHAHPNPRVGCVIVAPDGRIIGEGWHRRCGGPHAEVNAVNSVAESDREFLPESTVYVTLEPCAHYGKTPPCAEMLARLGVRRVVVAMRDPFPKVDGRGIEILRQAGIQVEVGLLEQEARELNPHFLTAHALKRPYVTLKRAVASDGRRANLDGSPLQISTPLTRTLVHRLRATHDAILVGSGTWLADSPRLDVRDYAGASPRRFVADRRHRLSNLPADVTVLDQTTPAQMLAELYARYGVTSVLIEGGPTLEKAFLEANLADALRTETNSLL